MRLAGEGKPRLAGIRAEQPVVEPPLGAHLEHIERVLLQHVQAALEVDHPFGQIRIEQTERHAFVGGHDVHPVLAAAVVHLYLVLGGRVRVDRPSADRVEDASVARDARLLAHHLAGGQGEPAVQVAGVRVELVEAAAGLLVRVEGAVEGDQIVAEAPGGGQRLPGVGVDAAPVERAAAGRQRGLLVADEHLRQRQVDVLVEQGGLDAVERAHRRRQLLDAADAQQRDLVVDRVQVGGHVGERHGRSVVAARLFGGERAGQNHLEAFLLVLAAAHALQQIGEAGARLEVRADELEGGYDVVEARVDIVADPGENAVDEVLGVGDQQVGRLQYLAQHGERQFKEGVGARDTLEVGTHGFAHVSVESVFQLESRPQHHLEYVFDVGVVADDRVEDLLGLVDLQVAGGAKQVDEVVLDGKAAAVDEIEQLGEGAGFDVEKLDGLLGAFAEAVVANQYAEVVGRGGEHVAMAAESVALDFELDVAKFTGLTELVEILEKVGLDNHVAASRILVG